MPEDSLSVYLSKTDSRDKWERIGIRRRSGVLVPLFSVYSEDSLGIGDLADLKLLVDWADKTGNTILQLLPMNETGATRCPYDSISSFAIEPVYVSLALLPKAKSERIKARVDDIKRILPAERFHVDYRIKKEKIDLLWEIYLQEKAFYPLEFQSFLKDNAYWLDDFALYKAIKDCQDGKPWYEWEDKYRNRNVRHLEIFRREHEERITFEQWVQWQLYKQLREAKRYAAKKNVLIKGDLPILISRDSADVWVHPQFFKLDYAAGAPPDMYCAKGQRWGMPTYNWERISAEGYRYLREKLRYAENFYDILRVDHVVGLFRIWSIPFNEPYENRGLNGFFDPSKEAVWKEHGRAILSVMLNSTKMLLCAEDLGLIPKVCPQTLRELGIPGNDVQRWVKDWDKKHDFIPPNNYRELSVAMLSTHDTTNWPAWWENEAGTVDEALFIRRCSDHRSIDFGYVKDKLFDLSGAGRGRLRWLDNVDTVNKLVSILGRKKEELADFIDMYQNTYGEKEKLWKQMGIKGPLRDKSDSGIVSAALKISLNSSAIFCINTIADWLYLSDIFKGDPYQYRINTPGTVSINNWSLVMPISLEDLLEQKINKNIRSMLVSSGRA